MFSFFQNKLTEANNHYIDWSRSGQSVDLKNVAAIATSILVSGYLNNEEVTGMSDLTMGITGGLSGLLLLHLIMMPPLAYKRYLMNLSCQAIIKEIETYLAENKIIYRAAIDNIVDNIMQLSLSDEKMARATQTWGCRKRLLDNTLEALKNQPGCFWQQDNIDILNFLNEPSTAPSLLLR